MSEIILAAPPAAATATAGWLQRWRKGLAGSKLNLAITVFYAGFVWFVLWPFLRWATIDATFSGTAADCRARGGACWAFVSEKARFLFFGLYPSGFDGQAALATIIIAALVVATAVPRLWTRHLAVIWVLAIGLALGLMGGKLTGNPVSTQNWGGFPLTLLLATVGFAGAFPLGVALALGRRSRLALLRWVSVAFIETLRGVPMIAVLYVSTLILPLMLPGGNMIDKLLRAQVAIVLFAAAYMAEIIRAGLQSVSEGQREGGVSLGLTEWQTMRLVLLPQALKVSIPAFVNLGIGLFLDTTLVIVIGLFDFLNTARVAATDPNWLGFYNEAFTVAAIVYFTLSAVGSRYSLWLEARLATSHRH